MMYCSNIESLLEEAEVRVLGLRFGVLLDVALADRLQLALRFFEVFF